MTRSAVRAVLGDVEPRARVLVACSGGADSLALAAAAAFEAPGRAGAVVVDHGLQDGSAAVAARAADQCAALGLAPVVVVPVDATTGPGGPEAAARAARYAALERAAREDGAALVLLGHTLDDQAEQVLLGLLRGSGTRSLAGMPPARGLLRRPFLGVTRRQTEEACAAAGLDPWHDPHNTDPAYRRTGVRTWLDVLEAELGPGLRHALARSAEQLREDGDLLDALADAALADVTADDGPDGAPGHAPVASVARLAALPRPVRTRVWRRLLVAAGAPAGALGSRHTDACDALVTGWRGQGPLHVPGGLAVGRTGDRVFITPRAPVEWARPPTTTAQE